MRACVRRRGGAHVPAGGTRAPPKPAPDAGPGARHPGLDPQAVRRLGGRPPALALVDYGTKRSIARRLARAGAAVTVFPHSAVPDELATYDGVVLSNGPGDPEPLVEARSAATSGATHSRSPVVADAVLHDRRADSNADSNRQSVRPPRSSGTIPRLIGITVDHRGPFGWTYEPRCR
jgi:hypothetical protein